LTKLKTSNHIFQEAVNKQYSWRNKQ